MKTLVFLLALGLDCIAVAMAVMCITGLISGNEVATQQGLHGFALMSFIACMSGSEDFRNKFKQSISGELDKGLNGVLGIIFITVGYFIGAAIGGIILIPCMIMLHVQGLIKSLR